MQYSLIAKSLLSTALEHLEKKEAEQRLKSTESSSQLFGLLPRDSRQGEDTLPSLRQQSTASFGASLASQAGASRSKDAGSSGWLGSSPGFSFDMDSAFAGLAGNLDRTPGFSLTGLSLDSDPDQAFGALNLFPLLETEGHIDLTHYF